MAKKSGLISHFALMLASFWNHLFHSYFRENKKISIFSFLLLKSIRKALRLPLKAIKNPPGRPSLPIRSRGGKVNMGNMHWEDIRHGTDP